MSWKWFHNGNPVGEGPVLTIESMTAVRYGVYSVMVTGAAGSTAGVVARLEPPVGPRIVPGTPRFDTGELGGFKFDVDAPVGIRFGVIWSTNLVHWQELLEETGQSNPVRVMDPKPPGDVRFYRVEPR
jgi:hypothetical protein